MSEEIIDIIGAIVSRVHEGLEITVVDYKGLSHVQMCPKLNFVFGNSRDVKARLDEMSKSAVGTIEKLPMIALFTPIVEKRDNPQYSSVANVNLLIAHSSQWEWNNEQRRDYSFKGVLRPIYSRFLELLIADKRLDFGYRPIVKHKYSENYSYGKYGALTSTGEKVSEPIDAIDIRDLEIKVKLKNCR